MRTTVSTAAALAFWLVTLTPEPAAAEPPATPQALLDAWVGLWGSYDLDVVGELFVRDDRLTYFSSEFEGLIRGYDAIVEHHRGFGFVPGGTERDSVIWVEDAAFVELGTTVMIGAICYFGDPDSPGDAQKGPMTVLAVPDGDGFRIGHMHFATYAASEEP